MVCDVKLQGFHDHHNHPNHHNNHNHHNHPDDNHRGSKPKPEGATANTCREGDGRGGTPQLKKLIIYCNLLYGRDIKAKKLFVFVILIVFDKYVFTSQTSTEKQTVDMKR